MKYLKIFCLILILSINISCARTGKTIDIKSPCVSAKNGPCEPKVPVNDWWLKNYKTNS